MSFAFFFANPPQSKKTTSFFSAEIVRITWSVKVSHPLPWCEPASCARTVSVALSNNTPCLAQWDKLPDFGIGRVKSLCSSLNILTNDGGGGTLSFTEKHNPCAWSIPWYGSWPSITTFTL